MANFVYQPVTLKTTSGGNLVVQAGDQVTIDGGAAGCYTVAEIEANPKHWCRRFLPALREAGAVALVKGAVAVGLTAEQYALGAGERARYAAWVAELRAAKTQRQSAERAFDAANNEGGEGYNPHRYGAAQTYGGGDKDPTRESSEAE